jgi:hypothetical protein
MFTTITVKRIGVGSLYKLFAIGLGCGMLPLGLLLGVLAFFGANTVAWNGQQLRGAAGLVGGPLIGLFLTVLFTVLIGSICALGLWLFSLVRPLQITFQAVAPTDAP